MGSHTREKHKGPYSTLEFLAENLSKLILSWTPIMKLTAAQCHAYRIITFSGLGESVPKTFLRISLLYSVLS